MIINNSFYVSANCGDTEAIIWHKQETKLNYTENNNNQLLVLDKKSEKSIRNDLIEYEEKLKSDLTLPTLLGKHRHSAALQQRCATVPHFFLTFIFYVLCD